MIVIETELLGVTSTLIVSDENGPKILVSTAAERFFGDSVREPESRVKRNTPEVFGSSSVVIVCPF
jgi:hypothetical protein